MKKIIAILIMASLLMPMGVGAESIQSQIARIQALIKELQIKLEAMQKNEIQYKIEEPNKEDAKHEKNEGKRDEEQDDKKVNKIKTQEDVEGETPEIVPEGFMRRARA